MIKLTDSETGETIYVKETDISGITLPERLLGGEQPTGSILVLNSGVIVRVAENPDRVYEIMNSKFKQ